MFCTRAAVARGVRGLVVVVVLGAALVTASTASALVRDKDWIACETA